MAGTGRDTPLTPTGQRLLLALYDLEMVSGHGPALASDLAYRAKLGHGVRRNGSGAKGGHSYSGWQQPGFVLGGACTALVRRGYAWSTYGHRGRAQYRLKEAGRVEARRLLKIGLTADTPLWWDVEWVEGNAVYEGHVVRTCLRCGHGGKLSEHGPDKCPNYLGWPE
jgi:hypothetical protein